MKSSNGLTLDHRSQGRQTSGTAGRIRSAPSTGALSVPSRTPAATSPAIASRCNRWSLHPRIEPREIARQHLQRCIGDLPNRPQRMINPDALLQVYVAEKASTNLVVPTHRTPIPHQGDHSAQIQQPFFNSLLGRPRKAEKFGLDRRPRCDLWPSSSSLYSEYGP